MIAVLWGGPHDGTEVQMQELPEHLSLPLLVHRDEGGAPEVVTTEHYQYSRTNLIRNNRVRYKFVNLEVRGEDVT